MSSLPGGIAVYKYHYTTGAPTQEVNVKVFSRDATTVTLSWTSLTDVEGYTLEYNTVVTDEKLTKTLKGASSNQTTRKYKHFCHANLSRLGHVYFNMLVNSYDIIYF